MDFALTERQKKLKKELKEFLRKEVERKLLSWYKKDEIPREFYRALNEREWLGFRRERGGWTPFPMLETIILYEEMAALSPGLAVSVLAHSTLGLFALDRWGTHEQRERYFEPACRGEMLVAFANTEPTAGSDAAAIRCEAKETSGRYLLTGSKMFITNGPAGDLILVSAVTNPRARRASHRISLFIVPADLPNIRRQSINKQVWRPASFGTLFFSQTPVPRENLLGEPHRGFPLVMQTFTQSRIAISALTVGTAWGAYRLALERARTRTTFGKRLIEHEAKAFEFSDMLSRLEAARLLVHRAAWRYDRGEDHILEASLAKYFCVEETRAITHWAADVFGASSVMEENPIFKFPWDAQAASLGEGTQDIQKLIISRELEKRFPPEEI